MKENMKILIGSPIRQEFDILFQFTNSLKSLLKENISVDYYFIDNNTEKASSDLLLKFAQEEETKVIVDHIENTDSYIRTDYTHFWKDTLIWKVAEYKNKIIHYCEQEGYDYLFLIDSDLVLHPRTLMHLIDCNKDIISEIFWTKWQKDTVEMPQVWLYDEYSMVPKERSEVLSDVEAHKRYVGFIQQLRKPGNYEVGGLGACTLISKHAINMGANFSKIYNLSFWGEDRHFCIRAAALGLKLYVDTYYPAYHIYRKEDLAGVDEFIKSCSII